MADSDYDNIYGGADDEVDYGMASPVTTPKTELDNNAAAGPSQSSFQEQQRQIPSQSYNQVKSAPSDVQMARSLGGDSGNAQSALLVHEMHWWTRDEDIKEFCQRAGVYIELRDVTFSEHKVNGKSKGSCYITFTNPEDAAAVEQYLHEHDIEGKKFLPEPTPVLSNSPFLTLPKEANPSGVRDRGGYRGGRGGVRQNILQQQSQQQQQQQMGAFPGAFGMPANMNMMMPGFGMMPFGGGMMGMPQQGGAGGYGQQAAARGSSAPRGGRGRNPFGLPQNGQESAGPPQKRGRTD